MLSLTTQHQIDAEWERKADAFQWEDKHPAHPTTDIRNDAVRNAFDAIAKAVIPLLDHKYAYYSDLLWDASAAADMTNGDTLFIVVRDVGTSIFNPHDQSVEAIRAKQDEAMQHVDMSTTRRAVVKLMRNHYDTFRAAVVYERHHDNA